MADGSADVSTATEEDRILKRIAAKEGQAAAAEVVVAKAAPVVVGGASAAKKGRFSKDPIYWRGKDWRYTGGVAIKLTFSEARGDFLGSGAAALMGEYTCKAETAERGELVVTDCMADDPSGRARTFTADLSTVRKYALLEQADGVHLVLTNQLGKTLNFVQC